MKDAYCYWTIALGTESKLAESLIGSARQSGVFKDIHIWTDAPGAAGTRHEIAAPQKPAPLFALEVLQTKVHKLNYTHYVWLSPDTWFVRNPGNVLRVLHGAPVHAALESDLASLENTRSEWEGCTRTNHLTIMRYCGVRSRAIFTAARGFWIVHREVVDTFCERAWNHWELCEKVGYIFSLEPVLACTVQMLCGNPYVHTLRHTADLWAVDRRGCFAGRVPDGGDWTWVDEGTGKEAMVNPAIVHAPHSRTALAGVEW
jgi:hypothetical protein